MNNKTLDQIDTKPTDEPNTSVEALVDETAISDNVMEAFTQLMSTADLLSDLDEDELEGLYNILHNEEADNIKDWFLTIQNLRGGI